MSDPLWKKNYPVDIDWNQDIETGALFDLIDEAAEKYPDRPAMKFFGRQWTYQEIKELTDKAAKGFQDMGVKKGTKVALILPNSPYYLVNYFGILKAGGTVVNMNPLYSADEMTPILEDSEAEIIVSFPKPNIAKNVKKAAKNVGIKKFVNCPMTSMVPSSYGKSLKGIQKLGFPVLRFYFKHVDRLINIFAKNKISFNKLVSNNGKYKPVEINPEEDIALFQFTSGTTGRAKAVMLTHENLTANVSQSNAWFKTVEPGKDKMLAVIPFFHVLAMTVGMNLSIKNGMEIIAHPEPIIENIVKSIDEDKPTHMIGIPQLYSKVMGYEELNSYNLNSLKFCLSGGGPLAPATKENFEKITGCDLVEGYGLSEASPVVTCTPIGGLSKAGSIGLPMPGTDVQLRDPANGNEIKDANKRGEICVKGRQVMKGYFNNKAATDETMYSDNYLRTGDVATMDEDGYFFIVDRIKNLIISRGNNVYPAEVEKAIYGHDAVEECIVLGLSDEKRGERVTAFIKLKDGKELTAEGLTKFLNGKLAPYKMPKQVEFETEPLPTNATGKHLPKEMRRIYDERQKEPKAAANQNKPQKRLRHFRA